MFPAGGGWVTGEGRKLAGRPAKMAHYLCQLQHRRTLLIAASRDTTAAQQRGNSCCKAALLRSRLAALLLRVQLCARVLLARAQAVMRAGRKAVHS